MLGVQHVVEGWSRRKRPEEKLRARRMIREQWAHIAGYLDEYRRLAGGVLPDHLEELAVRSQGQ